MRRVLLPVFAALGMVCLWYGYRVSRIASGSGFYRIWYVGGVCCFGLGAFCCLGLWRRLPAVLRTAVLLMAAVFFLLFLVIEAVIIRTYRTAGEEACDVLIVCGAQINGYSPSVILENRLKTAKEYLLANPAAICIVSGGRGENEPCAEAELMKEWLIREGIPGERILTETQSTNTAENMRYSVRLIPEGAERIGVLTSNFHLYRAKRLLAAAGVTVSAAVGAPSAAFYLPNNLLREFCGVIKDFLVGNFRDNR